MRDDRAFLGDLRSEINQGQQRRHEYIAAKLMFVAGLLGLGSLSIENVPTRELFFIVPIVAFAYDLYSLGEDYGIRRAAAFIRSSTVAPPQELLWEQMVQFKRDPFAQAAGPLTSFIALVISAVGLFPLGLYRPIYGAWIILNLLLIGCVFWYRRRLVENLRKWEGQLKERQYEPASQLDGTAAEGAMSPNTLAAADAPAGTPLSS